MWPSKMVYMGAFARMMESRRFTRAFASGKAENFHPNPRMVVKVKMTGVSKRQGSGRNAALLLKILFRNGSTRLKRCDARVVNELPLSSRMIQASADYHSKCTLDDKGFHSCRSVRRALSQGIETMISRDSAPPLSFDPASTARYSPIFHRCWQQINGSSGLKAFAKREIRRS